MFRLSSNWAFDSGAASDCLSVTQGGETPTFSPDDVSLDTCFCLSPPASPPGSGARVPCNLVLTQLGDRSSRRPRLPVDAILLVGAFRRVEVLRPDSGEYVGTFKGAPALEGAEADPDLPMFLVDVDLRGMNLKSVELRFPSPPEENAWVLALRVGLRDAAECEDTAAEAPTAGRLFNLARLDSMLGGAELSDKAKDFKKLFSDFQQGASALPGLSLMSLGSQVPAQALFSETGDGACVTERTDHNGDDNAENAVITKRDLDEFEARVNAKLAMFAMEQNAKLSKIIQLLEAMNKPKS